MDFVNKNLFLGIVFEVTKNGVTKKIEKGCLW